MLPSLPVNISNDRVLKFFFTNASKMLEFKYEQNKVHCIITLRVKNLI